VYNILLVEDSTDVLNLVRIALGNLAHIEWAKSLSEASKAVHKKAFDLILLDVMLPDGDGYRLCSILQTDDQMKNVPVIFLTAKNSVSDKVLGFSVGADDFISKPFDGTELKARIEARLRKRDREKMRADILKFGDLEINKTTQRVQIYEEGVSVDVDLTPIEFKLLLLLCKQGGKVYSREEILNTVWGDSIHVYNRSVDTHVSKLRKKLGSKADFIESVHGTGYRFVLEDAVKPPRVDVNVQQLAY
jgi:DNA-binding response OmpR family regulator